MVMVEVVAAVTLTLGMLLVWKFRAFAPIERVMERSFWCPAVGQDVTVAFRQAVWDGRPFEMMRPSLLPPPKDVACSAFPPPAFFRCGKRCLTDRRFCR